MKTKSLDTPTIDVILEKITQNPNLKLTEIGWESLGESIEEAKQALLQWVLDVIGEDEDKFADVPDYAMMKPVYHVRNTLRAEQRAKLKSIEESK